MTTPPDDALEHLLRSGLRRRAVDAPDRPDLDRVRGRAAIRLRRRRLRQVGLASTAVLVAAASVTWGVSAARGHVVPSAGVVVSPPAVPERGPMTGSLVLPLTGSVEAGALQLVRPGGGGDTSGSRGPTFGGSEAETLPHSKGSGSQLIAGGTGAADDQTIDVPPGTGQTLDRLATRVSSEGVIISTFYATSAPSSPSVRISRSAATTPSSRPAGASSQAQPLLRKKRATGPADSCAPSGEVTIEISDTQAVATFTEPIYGGYTAPLVDVEIGELGVVEGSPATWVEAEVGPAAERVVVQFADGYTDSAAPAGGVAVLAHLGEASTTLGDGSKAILQVLGAAGAVLAQYQLGVGAPAHAASPTPNFLPSSGASQPSDPDAARTSVGQALAVALSCSEPPVAQSQAVLGGGPFEELGGAGSSGLAKGDRIVVDKVVFTNPTSAVVRFQVDVPAATRPPALYAGAVLVHGTWLLSIASVAPGLQVAPAAQDGDVAVAPGGPIYVRAGSGGVAIAVYHAVRSGPSGNGCAFETCSGEPPASQCVPTGGVVEEITTPGAVGIVAAPLFGSYTTPLIGIGLSIVGEAEGSPATVLALETGPGASVVTLATHAGTETITPAGGVADTVLAGAPAASIGTSGATLTVAGASGAALVTVPLQVDNGEPAPASTLPSTLPPPGSGTPPADPAAATAAIEQVFSTVFGCASSPFVRAQAIEDNGLFSNPLEQLYLGPYTSLVESVYATVESVVFVSPTLADVGYTIRFHNDDSLSFSMIGTAAVVDGTWRVSYATLCRAVALGGVQCSS
jgi:hypothetical protein